MALADPPAILVIDDNPDNLRVAVAVLEGEGHRVRTARSGERGIERAAAPGTGLILLDVDMPVMDGYETCRRLKADRELAEIPVIFMTAHREVGAKVRAFDVGAVDYVTKPFDAAELIARVRTHLQIRALRDEVAERNRELEELNATLQERVDEQVATLARRADEVERLNAQLRKQVQDRSAALRLALSRLSTRGRDSDDDLAGTVLDGRYFIDSLLAVGGMGAVYRGRDKETELPVAVKVIRSAKSTPDILARFLREARVAAAVDHPGVVQMLHIDVQDDGMLYQVQEFVEGEVLRSALERHGTFAVGPGARVLAALADALSAAHDVGVVHRDLKPGNVILTRHRPGLKLVDFGIALREPQVGDPTVEHSFERPTQSGVIVGTPRFMGPEQFEMARYVEPSSDIYGLGVLAHLMWTGEFPVERKKLLAPQVAGIVNACLDYDPSERPSAASLVVEFEQLADSEGAPTLTRLVADDALGTP